MFLELDSNCGLRVKILFDPSLVSTPTLLRCSFKIAGVHLNINSPITHIQFIIYWQSVYRSVWIITLISFLGYFLFKFR